MTIRLIGDIHGNTNEYKMLLQNCQFPSIQLGDFGIGFQQGDYWHQSIENYLATNGHRFIRGNHDNPSMCKNMQGYIADGTLDNKTMFIGGAWSIDNPIAPPGWYRRTAGYDWWFDEECSEEEFDTFLAIYKKNKPEVMITHDCPHNISKQLFFNSGLLKGIHYPTRTGMFFQELFDIHQPKFWFFGHYHHTLECKIGNTNFHCLGELDYVDFNLTTLEYV